MKELQHFRRVPRWLLPSVLCCGIFILLCVHFALLESRSGEYQNEREGGIAAVYLYAHNSNRDAVPTERLLKVPPHGPPSTFVRTPPQETTREHALTSTTKKRVPSNTFPIHTPTTRDHDAHSLDGLESSASLLGAMCSAAFPTSRAGSQESGYAYTLRTSFTTPFLPTHDTETYRVPRVSNGPLGTPLPRVAVLPTRHRSGIELANMCADRDDPLRVTLLLSRDSTEHLDDGGLAAEQTLRRQVDELMRPVVNTSREAVITVIANDEEDHIDNKGGKAEGVRRYRVAVVRYSTRALPAPNVTGMGRGEQELVKLSWLFDAPHTVEVVVPPSTRIALPRSWEGDPAGAQMRASAADSHRFSFLAEIARHSSPAASAASRALVTMPPHFVFEMPPGAVFRGRNLAALCRYEPVANDESEARAVYPYATAPFAYKGGAERLPLGFVLPAASAWAGGATVAGMSPPLVVVSSCRRPVRVVAPAVDSRHYSKGGDVVLRGAARMVYVRAADAFVPFFGGVHEDVILGLAGASLGDGAVTMPLGAREALFAMRRPLGSRCSSDPSDPTRVITHVPWFINEKRFGTFSGREFRVFVRVLLATALMTPFSDVIITTKASSALAQAAIRGTTRGVPPSWLVGHELTSFDREKGDSFKNSEATGNATLAAFDYCYPNVHGELVIVDYSHSPGNKRHVIAGLSQHQMFAGKGFYDIVRYTEQDLYITRDQFLLYCSTLSYMEMRNFFINFLRFEFNSSIIDDFEHVRDDPYDVKHAYSPSAYFFVDAERTFKPSQWHFAGVPEALLIQRSRGANQQATDAVRLTGQEYHLFEVAPGYRPREFCSFSQFSRAASLPAVPSVLNSSNVHNWRVVHPLAPTEQRNKSYSLEGCYVMAKPMHSMFKPSRVPRLYNGMWIVPDERLSTYFGGAVRSYLDQTSYHSGDREAVAYFNAPVIFYGAGVVLMRPYPRTADSRTKTTKTIHNRYIVDRLSLIHHGGNRYYSDIGNQLSFPIFDNVDPTPWRDP